MALNIKNPEVERLTSQLAILTGNTKTGAVGQAVRKELDRIKSGASPEPTSAELLLAVLLASRGKR
jgi:antitoxin VapB